MVGATGFEPATSCSQSKCSTGLSYAPLTAAIIAGIPARATTFWVSFVARHRRGIKLLL